MWSFVLAAVGILGFVLAGNHNKIGWLIGLFAQVLWIWYAFDTQQFGFLLTAIAYGVVYMRNFMKWDDEVTQ